MAEWGIFNGDSTDHTADWCIEAGFTCREEAEAAIAERYADEGDCYSHEIETQDEEDDDEGTDEDADCWYRR